MAQNIEKSKRQLGRRSGDWDPDHTTVHAVGSIDVRVTACGVRIGTRQNGWFLTSDPVTCQRNGCLAAAAGRPT